MMSAPKTSFALGTGSSVVVSRCQICGNTQLESVLFLGYFPPANRLRSIDERPQEEPMYPLEWLFCSRCQLVQLGAVVDPRIIFPPDFPYTTGLTKALRDNFAEMFRECAGLFSLDKEDLVIDVGSNDGTLLHNFKTGACRVLGVEPTEVGRMAIEKGIPTVIDFFTAPLARELKNKMGAAKIVTATNTFAHIEDLDSVMEGILELLSEDGVFICENHYLFSLMESLQYDTIYHEHLRYYCLQSLQFLMGQYGLEIIHAKKIPTHGGSIRTYAAKKGAHKIRASVGELLAEERSNPLTAQRFKIFGQRITAAKLELQKILCEVKRQGGRIVAIGAPARGSTLLHFSGLDSSGIIDCVLETKGSHKIGKFMAGTLIPILEESLLVSEQPSHALFLSWHIAEGLIPKIREKGFRGKFIIPLPEPHLVREN